jgi:hypothetical protein
MTTPRPEVTPFPRTKILESLKLMDTVVLDEFLIESSYEVWAADPNDSPALLKLANYLRKNDKVVVSKHSFGRGFNQNYALLYPVFKDGSFVLVMALTKMRKEYKHLMEITSKDVEKPKALAILLPEI